jgi:hypothetical protein
VSSRSTIDTGQMVLWILGTTLVAIVAGVLSWGSYEEGTGVEFAAPPSEARMTTERMALVEPGRPDH